MKLINQNNYQEEPQTSSRELNPLFPMHTIRIEQHDL